MASRLTAAEKLAMIQKAWDAGLIVYICTATRRTRMTAPLQAELRRLRTALGYPVCGCETCRYREAQRDAVRRRVHHVLNLAFARNGQKFGDRSDMMTDYFDSDYTFRP